MRQRRNFTSEDKAQIVLSHLQDGKSVSDICDQFGITPPQFYEWKKQAFANLTKVFTKENSREIKQSEQKIASLESETIRQNSVIAELLHEHLKLKKKLGEK